jgi:hypothetical protein
LTLKYKNLHIFDSIFGLFSFDFIGLTDFLRND